MNELTFKRQSFTERGHVSNHFAFFPVRRLVFGVSELEICTLVGRERVPYTALRAELLETHIFKSIRYMPEVHVTQTLVTLIGPRRTYKLDLSDRFADFKESKVVLDLIRSRVRTTNTNESLASVKRRQSWFFAIILVPLLLVVAYVLSQQL